MREGEKERLATSAENAIIELATVGAGFDWLVRIK
jgi:hypothetical protein